MSAGPEEPHPQFEQLRRWFEARGGRLDALFETEGWSPKGSHPEGAVSAHQPSPATPERVRRRRIWLKVSLVAALAVVTLTAGAWLGRTWTRPSPEPIQAPAAPTVTRAVVPETCLTALRQSDDLVRLLKGKVRGGRLETALNAYRKSREACRKRAAGDRP